MTIQVYIFHLHFRLIGYIILAAYSLVSIQYFDFCSHVLSIRCHDTSNAAEYQNSYYYSFKFGMDMLIHIVAYSFLLSPLMGFEIDRYRFQAFSLFHSSVTRSRDILHAALLFIASIASPFYGRKWSISVVPCYNCQIIKWKKRKREMVLKATVRYLDTTGGIYSIFNVQNLYTLVDNLQFLYSLSPRHKNKTK